MRALGRQTIARFARIGCYDLHAMKLLCLSNGHGEDAIAVQVLRALRSLPNPPQLAALPLVGEGKAFDRLPEVPIVGAVRFMPSGGFVYMDGRQLWRDLRGGLLGLTRQQLRSIRHWVAAGGKILAVGDIVPLAFAWWSGAEYCFVGTAKSEYYLRDEDGWLCRPISQFEVLERWTGSVYLPWERWLMNRDRCRGVFPRDALTASVLERLGVRAFDLGNPAMEGLEPPPELPPLRIGEIQSLKPLVATLLPGSRSPEAYENWEIILRATVALANDPPSNEPLVFLAAIAPSLSLEHFVTRAIAAGWQETQDDRDGEAWLHPGERRLRRSRHFLLFATNAFRECLWRGNFAIAMAGTATEQFVGLGKPAIALPGKGPQYNPAFAEAQSRHLGPSLILLPEPDRVPATVVGLLQDPDRRQKIAENGRRRMGSFDAARQTAAAIAQALDAKNI